MDISINIVKLKEYASKCSVLYVEDDELIREQTADFLKRFFPDIVLANDGQEGLEEYQKREFDIVITDINMPHKNGIEMIEDIKKINYNQIILVTSAHNDSEYLMKLINLHVMKFVLKPFNNKQFLYVLYRIVEELTNKKESKLKQQKIDLLLKNAQIIVDQIKIGIVVIKNNKIDMVNRAFLKIGGFDSLKTLKLEMPEIGVLFANSSHCISATTNAELIKQLKIKSENEKKVSIIRDNETYEYQVSLSELEEEDSYILTFNDITAIHNDLYLDEHTKLPNKKFTLEKIELLAQSKNLLDTILISLKNFENIQKYYGKLKSIDIEIEFATKVKKIVQKYDQNAFIGYFAPNQIIILLNQNETIDFKNELKEIKLSLINETEKNLQTSLHLNSIVKSIKIDTNKELHEIEVELINAYELL